MGQASSAIAPSGSLIAQRQPASYTDILDADFGDDDSEESDDDDDDGSSDDEGMEAAVPVANPAAAMRSLVDRGTCSQADYVALRGALLSISDVQRDPYAVPHSHLGQAALAAHLTAAAGKWQGAG